uniref:Uncharacterized protein n=1 Tax=Anguilla anguilla TaxID=7936 RepID=A0A0E9R5N7_ANGAN
MKNKTFYNRGF